MTRLTRMVCVAVFTAGVSAVGLPGASAAQDLGMLRLAHLSPDTPAVDVYVNSVAHPDVGITLTGVDYGTVSAYQGVPFGTYTVSMRAAGADPSSPPVLSTTVDVESDSAHTVAGVGHFANLGLQVLTDDLTLPPAGQARVRVIDAAAGADSLDVSLAGGSSIAAGVTFADTSDYVDIPAGVTRLQINAGNGAPTQVPVDVAAGSVYSVLVLDRPGGGLTVHTVLDAASPGIVPVGSVPAGEGGTAGSPPVTLLASGIAVLAAAALLLTTRGRLPRRVRRARHTTTV